jgi:hypothetical protein
MSLKFDIMKRTVFLFISFCLLAMTEICAQTIPVNKRFGKVSKEELELSEYAPDTSAVALVLYEKQYSTVDMNATGAFALTTKTHMRIKILKEEGLDWGDFEMIYYSSVRHKETYSGIDVITFNLVDGKIVETKMPNKYIFNEDYVEDYKKLTFSAQGVKVGSVIEVKYEFTSSMYWRLDHIYFQKTIPVNLTECEVRLPDFFTFNKKMSGYHPVAFAHDVENSTLPTSSGPYVYNVEVDKYSASDVPAFRKESFIFNSRQYYSGVRYDISSMRITGVLYEDYSMSWSDVDDNYLDSEFYRRFRSGCQFSEEMAAISAEDSDQKKIEAVVRLVQNKVSWNNEYEILPDPLAQVVKSRTGSNADMNCLAAGCLRELGYTVEPVLIKLRSSGILLDYQPELNPFDTFILRVVTPANNVVYLDCAASEGYLNVLDPLMLVTNGRVLRPQGRSEWADLTKLASNSTSMYVTAALDDAGNMTGKISTKYKGEESWLVKADFTSCDDEEEFIKDLEDDLDVEIEGFSSKGLDEYSSDASYEFNYSYGSALTGDVVYINPFFVAFHSKDSFQSIARDYPIDFPFPYTISYFFNMTIPEGYAVDQLPETMYLKLPELQASVKIQSRVSGNILQLVYNYSQAQTIGLPADYQSIRTFWQYLSDIYESMIVLKKI